MLGRNFHIITSQIVFVILIFTKATTLAQYARGPAVGPAAAASK